MFGIASNPQTPDGAQQRVDGASVPFAHFGAGPERSRLDIGVSQPKHAKESRQARDGALKDVNAPSRCQGNRASS